MSWRIVNETLLVGRYAAPAASKPARSIKQKIAAFDFVRLDLMLSHPKSYCNTDS